MRTTIFAALSASLLAFGCRTTDTVAEPYDRNAIQCMCGSLDTDVHGCHCPLCDGGNGPGNPQNPDCVCDAIHPAE